MKRTRISKAAKAAAALTALGLTVAGAAGCSSSGPSAAAPSGGASGSSASGGPSSTDTASSGTATPLQPLPTAVPADLQSYYGQKLSWQACDSGFQCTTFKVPLDYDHPGAAGGGDLTLSVVRKQATGQGVPRLGSLLVNPGGPGGSAVDYAEYAAMTYPSVVRAAYDIVGVDPRGVARSAPVQCLTDAQMDAYTAVDTTPTDQSGVDALVAADKSFAQGCQKHSGQLLSHVSTVDSARDMDVLRALLGDEKLHYLGKSYGTFLGATYAGLFPTRVGTMVLDGAMNPSLNAQELNAQQAGGFQVAFDAFAADCVKRPGCALGNGSVPQADAKLDAFFKSLDANPLPTGDPRKLVEALGMTGVISAMYDPEQWPDLRLALADAINNGNGKELLALSDNYYERDPTGHYANLMYANAAVNCLDLPTAATGPDQVRQQLPAYEKSSPQFGASLAWGGLTCAYWPVAATGSPHVIPAKGAAPILVVGTTRDPATPYAWAQGLAAQLDTGTLLTFVGDGHTAYARNPGGSACIDEAVNRYLLQGTVPPKGTVCH
ncbi:alpha/beta hydrolase [Streptacidiphilus jiangxiensis]|uniref:Alpha/beta hydrolase fold n=1 Tax=Streptacidiphilus jiangxiensis TaxID=235985 RepID=A0A1H7PW20_STRJI|nr:alpha/beta hydrolase [Streptacidiphilus jiangxiensis]SEL39923.1 alpha/beta hydrolase fold [Streptacidiphilus jiangxiensis]